MGQKKQSTTDGQEFDHVRPFFISDTYACFFLSKKKYK